jgi:hypothetical protein
MEDCCFEPGIVVAANMEQCLHTFIKGTLRTSKEGHYGT